MTAATSTSTRITARLGHIIKAPPMSMARNRQANHAGMDRLAYLNAGINGEATPSRD